MEYSYSIITGHNQQIPHPRVEAIYEFCMKSWSQVYASNNSSNPELESQFWNCSRIYALFKDEAPIGIHFSTVYERAFPDSYWSHYPQEALDQIRFKKNIQVLSHFLVDPTYHTKQSGALQIPRVLAGLSFKNQTEHNHSCSVTICRRDVGVHILCEKFGGQYLSEPQDMFNTPVSPMVVHQPIYSCITNVELFNSLWANRVPVDLAPLHVKKAA